MALKEIPYCTIVEDKRHPKGGYILRFNAKDKGYSCKSERKFWIDDYPNLKACYDAIEQATVSIKAEVADKLRRKVAMALSGKHVAIDLPTKIVTMSDLITLRIAREGDSGIPGYFRRIDNLCGNSLPEFWRDTYYNVINKLKNQVSYRGGKLSSSTLNRYKAAFSLLFSFAQKEGVIDDLEIEYDMDVEEGRDRILSPEEWIRLQGTMKGHWLEMAIYFSYYNPIRVSDLFGFDSEDTKKRNEGIRLENWIQDKNYVVLNAHKTYTRKKNKKVQPTYLLQIDEKIREYFYSLPTSSKQHLFPRMFPNGDVRPVKMSNGHREYREDFEKLLKDANIDNFTWHDLKHCAITNIVKNLPHNVNVFVYLKKMGIQHSEKMVLKYTNYTVEDAPRLKGFK